MKISRKELEAVLQLAGEKRYEYFIKKVVDWEEVWGLYLNGWVLAADDDENPIFPLWPSREYAEACASGDWDGHEASSVELEDLQRELLPSLAEDGISCGVFYTPSDKGVVVGAPRLIEDLKKEAEQYN